MMTPAQAYEKARTLYRLMRKGDGWSVLVWRCGLDCWERLPPIHSRWNAIRERAGLVTAHALMLLGLQQSEVAKLLCRHYTGPARDRIKAAWREHTEGTTK